MHRTVKKVTEDIEGLRFNTAVSALMVLTNGLLKVEQVPKLAFEKLLALLNPFAPHISEELWARLGHPPSLAHAAWPAYDLALTVEDQVEVVVQVNGKIRARFETAKGTDDETLKATAQGLERIAELLAGQTIRRIIVVQDKLVNIVIG